MAETRVGTSGWAYPSWRATFYPKGLPQRRELEYASRHLNSVEINGTFYSLQTPDSFQRWFADVPDEFLFAVKGSRFITHVKRLKNLEGILANFFASGILCLGHKLGPILWQLPPNLRFDEAVVEGFLHSLPRTTAEAAELAQEHDERLRGRSWTLAEHDTPLRYALEIRHESFCAPAFVDLLRRHGVASVVSEGAGRWPMLEDVTADFVYVRLHGSTELYASGYSEPELGRWADRIRIWQRGDQPAHARLAAPGAPPPREPRDVHVYFDNDAWAHAPFDAMALAKRLGLGAG